MNHSTLTVISFSAPKEPPIDIYARWRAEIAARDWRACHVRGDRSAPVELADRTKRGWRG